MFAAAVVCPHPPLLVPAVSVLEPDWLVELRAACRAAVAALLASAPDVVAVVGSGPRTDIWDDNAGGTLGPYGVEVAAGGTSRELPLSLTVGAWLLDEHGWRGPRCYAALAAGADAAACAQVGAGLVTGPDRVALLVMGDGSARRTTDAPGYLDERAEGYDAAVSAALAAADADALLGLEPALADDLWVAGRQAWQALAGAALTSSALIAATVGYHRAPAGVGYLVANWTPRYDTGR